MLTSNGICYSFNGEKPSNYFNDGKIVNSLERLTKDDYPSIKFKGPGAGEGLTVGYNIDIALCFDIYCISILQVLQCSST